MESVQVALNVPKESKEVLDAVLGLWKELKAKKPLAEVASSSLPALMTAVDGYEKLGAEVKEGKEELAAYAVKELMSLLAPNEAPAAPEAQA